MKSLLVAVLGLLFVVSTYAQTDYEAQMVRDDIKMLNDLARKAESEDRMLSNREKSRKRDTHRSIQIDIKSDISKVSALVTQLLMANGYSKTYSSGNQSLFIAEIPSHKVQPQAVIAPNKFSLFTQVVAALERTTVSIYISPLPNKAFITNKIERDAVNKIEATIKSLLRSIKREAENSH